jgi:hypothetical protein
MGKIRNLFANAYFSFAAGIIKFTIILLYPFKDSRELFIRFVEMKMNLISPEEYAMIIENKIFDSMSEQNKKEIEMDYLPK